MQLFPAPESLALPMEQLALPSLGQRIFCNRSLRLEQIDAVGFDMDYTLAVYRQQAMDRQSVAAALPKLMARGYPPALERMVCRFDFPIRGLLVDRKLGHVLKLDRHRYVKRAYHGMRELCVEERRTAYRGERVDPTTGRYHSVDTLYAFSEVSMYAGAIDALEAAGHAVDFARLFDDIHTAIDESHQDGTILGPILADLPAFVAADPLLGETLHKLRSAGKRLFLLTNSQPEHAERVMEYLLPAEGTEYGSWRRYFDIIVAQAQKPRFFVEDRPFERFEAGLRVPHAGTRLERGQIYVGGNMRAFQEALGVDGDSVLYVGDHIYGDVLRAKKSGGWRTAMIVQEMDRELTVLANEREDIARLASLELASAGAARLVHEHQARQWTPEGLPESERRQSRRVLEQLKAELHTVTEAHDALERELHRRFHPFWGPVFKAGVELSIFGNQVEEYACLYTTRVTNFLYYSPSYYFRSPRETMPHELHL